MLPKLLIPFDQLYVWENIWPNTVAAYVVYSIVYSFDSTFSVIKWLVWYVFTLIVGSNLLIGVACHVDLLTFCVIYSWLICSGGFSSSVFTPEVKIPLLYNSCNYSLSIYSLYVIFSSMVGSYSSSSSWSPIFSLSSSQIVTYLRSLNFSRGLISYLLERASTL